MTLREAVAAAQAEVVTKYEMDLRARLEKHLKKRANRDLAPYFSNAPWRFTVASDDRPFTWPKYSLEVTIEGLNFQFARDAGLDVVSWAIRQIIITGYKYSDGSSRNDTKYRTVYRLSDIKL